jgi:hypothetical protein
VTNTGATLFGIINPDGRAVTYAFRYGLTPAYGSTTTATPLPAGHTAVVVSAPVTGLLSGTIYHFQLVVMDAFGNTTSGDDQSFTTGTPLVGPIAQTLPVTNGSPPGNTATFNGVVTTNKTPTTWFFQYGTTTAYGQQTPATFLGATSIPVQVAFSVTLSPGTSKTWHYRLVATNAAGTSLGSDATVNLPLSGGSASSNEILALQLGLHAARLEAMRTARTTHRAHHKRHRKRHN